MLDKDPLLHRADVRSPAVAGQFYPADPGALRAAVSEYLDESGVAPAPGGVAALIVPHAGYPFSGPTAGFAYARVRGRQVSRVILLGRSHRHAFDGWKVYASGGFATPIGVARIDEAFAKRLAEETSDTRLVHRQEHALEVQIPFLQVALPNVPIVPILFGSEPGPEHDALAERLCAMTDDTDLVVASTDLSHFLDELEANKVDRCSIAAVLEKDHSRLAQGLKAGTFSMCGGTAVFTAMGYARAHGAEDWRLLDYRTSAAASGDRTRVVGYAAVSMERAA